MRPPARLGVAWLATGFPVGTFVGWLAGIADDAPTRRIGSALVALGVAAALLGVALLVTRSARLRPVSLALSAAWVVVAVVVVRAADFRSDQLWGGGMTGGVALVTGLLALGRQRV